MLKKTDIKFIASLKYKKYRDENQLFIAEGVKIAEAIIKTDWPVEKIFATSGWIQSNNTIKAEQVSESELRRISLLETPNNVLLLCGMKESKFVTDYLKEELCLALDGIQDPGNAGTIIRIADWFGIKHIFAGCRTAELYNPKVIQSTMGAFVNIEYHSVNLEEFIGQYKQKLNNEVYGAAPDGRNIFTISPENKGMIVLGNEGQGISTEITDKLTTKLGIPYFHHKGRVTESLNVAVAAGIICSRFRNNM